MRFRRTAGGVVVAALVLTADSGRARADQRQADPTVPELLAAAGRYVAGYETSFGVVVAEERFQQSTGGRSVPGVSRRVTMGNVLLFNSGGAGWMAFRDVRIIDNEPVARMSADLAALATNPTREGFARAMYATERSGGLVLGNIARVQSVPTSALAYLRPSRQSLGLFQFDGMKNVDDVRVALLKFSERPHARVTTAGDFTVEGRFWIQPETGAVVQTVLTFTSAIYEHNVEVQYGIRSGIDGWVPIRMFESHSVGLSTTGSSGSGTGRVGLGPTTSYSDGLTTYQGHRKFEMKPAFAIR